MKIAVIGAGIAGVSLAKSLGALPDYQVELFDKGRGLGGRMSVRHTGAYSFDHGAQFFTARTTGFQAFLQTYQSAGLVEAWWPDIVTLAEAESAGKRAWLEPHYVALPNMNGLCKAIAADLDVRLNTEVDSIEQSDGRWWLKAAGECLGAFDWVVSTAPPEQTRRLFPNTTGQAMDVVRFDPCYALLLGCPGSLPAWDVAVVENSPVSWLAFNDRKPGRDSQPSLLVHADGAWSQAHDDTDREQVKQLLVDAVSRIVDIKPDTVGLHRWRYARVSTPLGQDFWVDEAAQLAACGDWCLGSRVEDAFTSASRLAQWFGST